VCVTYSGEVDRFVSYGPVSLTCSISSAREGSLRNMSNPWLPSPDPVTETESRNPAEAKTARKGANAPQPGVMAPDLADRLPRREASWPATVWWLGAHGGAGESTLASLAPGTRAAGHAWPIPTTTGTVHRVVLVARSNFSGLTSARKAAIDWASSSLGGGVQLAGIALMSDARGRVPKPLRDLEQVIAGGVPRVWNLPWVEAWRFGPATPADALPKEFHTLFSDLSLPLPGVSAHN